MVAFCPFGGGVHGTNGGGKDILPVNFPGGVGVFSFEGVGEGRFAEAFLHVPLVNGFCDPYLFLKVVAQGVGEHDSPVFFALSVADEDLAVAEVQILDAQAQAFGEAQSTSIEQFGHQLGYAAHFVDDGHGFLVGQYGGQMVGTGGPEKVGGERQVHLKDVFVQEGYGAERLVLGGGRYTALGGEIGYVRLDFRRAHFFGVAFVVEEDEAFDPVHVGLLGAIGVVLGADGFAHLVEEFFFLWGYGLRGGGHGFWLCLGFYAIIFFSLF